MSSERRDTDARGFPRTSLYLGATLYSDGASSPVRIRNISTMGALVEGSILPSVGQLIQLVRGQLIVHALVAWSEEGRCGLKFSGTIDVRQWQAAPSNTEQQRVDEIVRLVKAGAVPLPVAPLAQDGQSSEPDAVDARVCGDLKRACGLLEKLGAALAGDADVVGRYGHLLQNLDIAMQVIEGVEALIGREDDPDLAVTKLVALRRSADQALVGRA